MKKLFAVLAVATVLLPASVSASDHKFTRDGATYVYTVTTGAGGRQVIEGRRLPGSTPFRLVVKGDRVAGIANGQPVSFRTPVNKPAVLAAR